MSGKSARIARKAAREAVAQYGYNGQELITTWFMAQTRKPLKERLKLCWLLLKGGKKNG